MAATLYVSDQASCSDTLLLPAVRFEMLGLSYHLVGSSRAGPQEDSDVRPMQSYGTPSPSELKVLDFDSSRYWNATQHNN